MLVVNSLWVGWVLLLFALSVLAKACFFNNCKENKITVVGLLILAVSLFFMFP